jgi:hypothetical protein
MLPFNRLVNPPIMLENVPREQSYNALFLKTISQTKPDLRII